MTSRLADSALPVPLPPRTLILGGARSGKSEIAERRLGGIAEVRYFASGPGVQDASDSWGRRVAAHVQRRPDSWVTLEQPDVARELLRDGPPVLWDCVSTWTASHFGDDDFDGEVTRLLDAWTSSAAPVVAVSSEVGLSVSPSTQVGNDFRDALGRVNRLLADQASQVWLVVAGRTLAVDPCPW